MVDYNVISTWILHDNLSLFLARIAVLIDYRFEHWDWDAVRFGVQDTTLAQNQWYEYNLSGNPPVELAFSASANTKRLLVNIKTEEPIAIRVNALTRIMQCHEQTNDTRDLETLIEAAFVEVPLPDQKKIVACSGAHLACCAECQETLSFYRGRHWINLLQEEGTLPYYVAHATLLTQEARRFFFPAYLVEALRDKDKEELEIALANTEQETWTPLQQELIDFVLTLCLKANRPSSP